MPRSWGHLPSSCLHMSIIYLYKAKEDQLPRLVSWQQQLSNSSSPLLRVHQKTKPQILVRSSTNNKEDQREVREYLLLTLCTISFCFKCPIFQVKKEVSPQVTLGKKFIKKMSSNNYKSTLTAQVQDLLVLATATAPLINSNSNNNKQQGRKETYLETQANINYPELQFLFFHIIIPNKSYSSYF